MKMKKVLAVVMSLCMTAGVVSYGAPVITQTITAQAEAVAEGECYSIDEETGVLTLSGKIDRNALLGLSYRYKYNVKSIIAEKGTVLPENSRDLFDNFNECTFIDLSNADTSNVTDMSFMFAFCDSLKTVDFSNINTSNVKSMSGLFYGCRNLTSLDLSSFYTRRVTSMSYMFSKCESLTSLDISSFITSNVTNMGSMFSDCTNLTTLDLRNFDTSKVTDMREMFYGCSGLTSLDVSSFDTKKVWSSKSMFENCSNLTSIDLSGFDASNIKYIEKMFKDCSKLKTISLGDKYTNIPRETYLPNGEGWVNANDPTTVISGEGDFAEIENSGKNTYKRLPVEEETKPTYPTNIKVEYSEKYHQVRFKWDEVEGADRYGIAVYLAGKWKVQTQNITDTVYTSPKNLTPGNTYKVAIAARVNGKWDTENAIKNAVTCSNDFYVKPDRELTYGADLYVIADEITMYFGPDTSYGKVTTIPQNTYLQELGDIKNNNNWAFTKYKGHYGWVQIVNESGDRQIQISYPYSIVAKPVIYLYPEKETDVHVEVELTEADLATTYPKYNNGWDIVAKPDGSLVNKVDGTHHRYLFWDAVNCRTAYDFSKGFCVAGSDTESFLKEKLSYMGLSEDEMNEFIVYWLPLMEHNEYNLISFQSEKYTDSAKLNITPAPDSMLRVFMTYVPLEEAVDIEPQELSTFERNGFTVVEWGGSEIK
ncbi:BspA family leucine-rich repeat surface protein [Ruminococcus sp.]|uniref:BspA family leucine-rich repeat surface protein n=1 Tax=Ruminococcus sp. TaxID=41978 RepID=UPI0025862439|nr:BspA family leucine-rich repeat surface protein [Ruminococcus sp.]MCR5021279.1 BspA family leucine-rich repeat surface protein [Ruminococcus sp.]